jgi:hypothetical protein
MEFYFGLFRSFFTWTKKSREERKARQAQLDKFLRDWSGEPAEPGRDRVPGVMERLNNIDGELKHNGGSTMKDAVKRIEAKLQKIDDRLASGDKRMTEIEKRINK